MRVPIRKDRSKAARPERLFNKEIKKNRYEARKRQKEKKRGLAFLSDYILFISSERREQFNSFSTPYLVAQLALLLIGRIRNELENSKIIL